MEQDSRYGGGTTAGATPQPTPAADLRRRGQLTGLAELIAAIGLRLSERLAAILDDEMGDWERRLIAAERRRIYGNRPAAVPTSGAGRPSDYEERRLERGKQRARQVLRRCLRSVEEIAVGRLRTDHHLGEYEILLPRWAERMAIGQEGDLVQVDGRLYVDVHVAVTTRLNARQYGLLLDHLAEVRDPPKPAASGAKGSQGRPVKRGPIEQWMRKRVEGGEKPATKSAAMRLAMKEVERWPQHLRVSRETVRRVINKHYPRQTEGEPPR